MDDVYNNINNCNPKIKRKNIIFFDDMIADINTKKKFQAIFFKHISSMFFTCRKYISCIYHTILFSCSKRSQIKVYTLSKNEDS